MSHNFLTSETHPKIHYSPSRPADGDYLDWWFRNIALYSSAPLDRIVEREKIIYDEYLILWIFIHDFQAVTLILPPPLPNTQMSGIQAFLREEGMCAII